MTPLVLEVMQKLKDYDEDKYLSLLKKYKNKRPEQIFEALEKSLWFESR